MNKVRSNSKNNIVINESLLAGDNAVIKNKLAQTESLNRIELQSDNVKSGLGKLVIILLKLIHELLEKQAIRRVDEGNLTEEQIEKLGVTLMKQAEELNKLREIFNLKEEDLNLNLGPLGKLL